MAERPVAGRKHVARRRRAFALLALALGLALGAAIVELGLRAFGYAAAGERPHRVFDPRYRTVDADSWIFDFRIDPRKHREVDLRGQRIALPKPEGEHRVLFIGDSATEGAFLPLEQAFPHLFEAQLRARDPNTRVRAVNAGVWGMTTIDAYHLLAERLLPLQPDTVVLGLFMANDINFNLGHTQRQLKSHAPLVLEQLRSRSALVQLLFLQALALNQRLRLIGPEHLSSRWIPRELALVDSRGLHLLSYPAGELALYLRQPTALVDEAFAVLRDVLAQFQALGARAGFELRVLLIPTPSAVTGRLDILHHPDILHQLRQQGVHVSATELDFNLPTRRVLAICSDLELTCVDPTRRFARLGLGAFFAGDEHPSARGHQALAEALLPR